MNINNVKEFTIYDYISDVERMDYYTINMTTVNYYAQKQFPGPYELIAVNYKIYIKIENSPEGMLWKLTNL